jgi:lysophospholipase L1-like esterase
VGDSIMLSASARYYDTLSMCGVTDAKVGRQLSEGIPVVASHAPYPSTVIVHLGTNGTVTSSQLDSLLRYVSGVPRVVLVTVQLNGARSWEAADNAAIKAAAGRWANVRIADWNAVSEGHGSWFGADSIHLTSSGAQAYASTIAAAL